MNTKRVFALVLLLMMVLVLTPVRAAKAEERPCPNCDSPLRVVWVASPTVHLWCCDNCGYEEAEAHTPDENCWCSVCNHVCHDDKNIGLTSTPSPAARSRGSIMTATSTSAGAAAGIRTIPMRS